MPRRLQLPLRLGAQLLGMSDGTNMGNRMHSYYRDVFRSDLVAFMGPSPAAYFGHSWTYSCRNQLARVPSENRPRFLICLYFTVLIDQAMHSHCPEHYQVFHGMTQYPKLCHGLSQFQHNPRGIINVPVEQGVVSEQVINQLLPDGMTLFVDETVAYFAAHLQAIEPRDFFEKLLSDPDVQIPLLLIVLDPGLKDDVVCVAYQELRAAVDKKLGSKAVYSQQGS
jgi:hypothetical protein